jgi:hypothetical protein
MTDRDPDVASFDLLIGSWATEATHPQFDGVVRGSTTFEWLGGGYFIIQRSRTITSFFPTR